MSINRVRSVWFGATGLPGISTFYLTSAPSSADLTHMVAFWTAIGAFLPDAVDIQVDQQGDVIDEATGGLTGAWTVATTPAVAHGTGLGAYAANAGVCLNWITGAVVHGRRLKGRTFIVPASPACFTSAGTPATVTNQIATAAAQLITDLGGSMVVWSRPQAAGAAGGARLGSTAAATGAQMSSKTAQLKSRRD